MKKIFKKLLPGKAGRRKDAPPGDVHNILKARYWNFKNLLKSNNEILETMAGLEETLRSGESFGMTDVRAGCTAISVNLVKMVQSLNAMSRDQYAELGGAADAILKKIIAELDAGKVPQGGPLVLALEEIGKESADLVGSKMANLGEIKNRLGLQVPDGFVVTASAYERFIEHNRLKEEINRRMQIMDTREIESLQRGSREIQERVLSSALPPEVEEAIGSAYKRLAEKARREIKVSLRSSALGEDAHRASFAGQYRSVLNVSADLIPYAYKEVVASKYALQAISYRLSRGFRDRDIAMSVGCMEMVDAVSGGVMYSRNPEDPTGGTVLVNSAWGLAKSVVDGTVSPDIHVVLKGSGKIVKRVVPLHNRDKKIVSHASEGVAPRALAPGEMSSPAITDSEAAKLAEIAVLLEDHFGAPQDIEWCINRKGCVTVLQSRPLQPELQASLPEEARIEGPQNQKILVRGIKVSGGSASGPAFVAGSALDMLRFPPGAILVTRFPSPQWAPLLPYAGGVVSEGGSFTGHLATVAREFGIPGVFGAEGAAGRINPGDLITVDGDAGAVYEGKVEGAGRTAPKRSLMEGSPVHECLKSVLGLITPLNLLDPDSLDFKPSSCRTVHDITRFCHEMAVKEAFCFGDEDPARCSARRLVGEVPMQWWVLDIEGGFREDGFREDGFREGMPAGSEKSRAKKSKLPGTIRIEDIVSEPMLALWEGITAVKWGGPPPVDAKGFLSIMFEATMNRDIEPTAQSSYTERNYFIISKDFCNLSSRFGFHFSTVEAFLGASARSSYISFNFKGGAADMARKSMRAEFIGKILGEFGFRTEQKGDAVFARIENREKEHMKESLKMLGYLIIHTRQIDMIMANDAAVKEYFDKFMKDIGSFARV